MLKLNAINEAIVMANDIEEETQEIKENYRISIYLFRQNSRIRRDLRNNRAMRHWRHTLFSRYKFTHQFNDSVIYR